MCVTNCFVAPRDTRFQIAAFTFHKINHVSQLKGKWRPKSDHLVDGWRRRLLYLVRRRLWPLLLNIGIGYIRIYHWITEPRKYSTVSLKVFLSTVVYWRIGAILSALRDAAASFICMCRSAFGGDSCNRDGCENLSTTIHVKPTDTDICRSIPSSRRTQWMVEVVWCG